AWDRKLLIDAVRVAEGRGFEVLHGIVDSLWVKKEGATEKDYADLRSEIEEKTGFPLSFEGVYKWVVFLPSKVDAKVPVLNRYFGVYRDGELKVRGIEARRHDTPLAFAECQMKMLRVLAEADSVEEAKTRVPKCVALFLRYAKALEHREVPTAELAFTTNLSKEPSEYRTMTVRNAALQGLVREGVKLHAGERVRYVIIDYAGHASGRAVALDLINGEVRYDSKRYIDLLARACSSVLEPFDPDCTPENLVRRALVGELLGSSAFR
ncbi:MAG: DNA polymerase domain-containing protein, partial [Nitrososphaerales archaeon]